MRQQLVAFHLYDLLLRRQPVRQRGVWLDRGQMGQEDRLFRDTLSRGDILHRHQLQSQLRHLHGAENRQRPLFSSHLSDTLYTRYWPILLSLLSSFYPKISPFLFLLSALELMGPRYRTFAGMVICMFFASAMSLLAVLVTRIVRVASRLVDNPILGWLAFPFFLSGLFTQALVHAVLGYLGSLRSSLQLLLDHPGVAAVAS